MLQYKTQSNKIISLFKEKLAVLNAGKMKFDLIDYSEDSVSLRCHMHIMTVKLKQENDIVNVIISFTFEGREAMAQQFASIGGDRAAHRIVEFLNTNLDSSEVTDSAVAYLQQKQAAVKKGGQGAAMWIIGGVVFFFLIWGIMMLIIFL